MDVVALLLMGCGAAEGATDFSRIATVLNGFFEVRCEFFFYVAVEAIGAKGIGETRPQRHITPS
jgi:hypothetical protein